MFKKYAFLLFLILSAAKLFAQESDIEKIGHPFLQHGFDMYGKYVAAKAGIRPDQVRMNPDGYDMADILKVVSDVIDKYYNEHVSQEYMFHKVEVAMLTDKAVMRDINVCAQQMKRRYAHTGHPRKR